MRGLAHRGALPRRNRFGGTASGRRGEFTLDRRAGRGGVRRRRRTESLRVDQLSRTSPGSAAQLPDGKSAETCCISSVSCAAIVSVS